jgi:hypothetical protein
MRREKREILERVLLLMKYDNKKTLSENYSGVISEQQSNLKIGQWLPNSDSRITNNKTKENFVRDTKSDGAYYIPLPPTDEYGEEIAPFNAWDGKIYKDTNGRYYIKYDEFISDPKNKIYPFRKSGKSKNYLLTKNGKPLTYNPIETTKGMVNPSSREIRGSDLFLDKSGKLKNPEKNLRQFLDFLDNPTQTMINDFNKLGNQSDYGRLINSWVDYIMGKNLNDLLDEYDKIVSYGKGGNTKDLPNYGKGTTTVSSIILENEIYNRKSQSGKNPIKPEDITGKPKKWIPKGYFFKTATDIYNQNYESYPKEENVNLFRQWFNYYFPEKSKNPCGDGEKLDKTGPLTKYVKCASDFKPNKIERKGLLVPPAGIEGGPLRIENGNQKSAYQLFLENSSGEDPLTKKNATIPAPNFKEDPIVAAKREGLIGMYYDGSTSDLMRQLQQLDPITYNYTEKDFEIADAYDEKDAENKIKSSPEYQEKQKDEFYRWVIKQQRVTNIYDSKWLECTIGIKQESECGETPYCGRLGKEFLEKIARGELKTKNGNTVGNPYRDSSGKIKYYLPDNFDGTSMSNQWDVPCSSDTWDEWGNTIQIGGALAGVIASWIIPPLGGSATLALLAELSIDAAAGAYALYQSVKEKDKTGIAFNSLFLALPFLLELPATDKLFKNIKYGKKGISDLTDKFEQFKNSNPQYTSAELADWLNGLSGYELATFKNVIKETESNPYFKQQMKDALSRQADIFKRASLGKRAWIPGTTLSKMLVYVGPMSGYIFGIRNKAIKDNLIRLQNNKQLTVSQVVAWDAALMGLNNDQYAELIRTLKNNPNYFVEQSNTPEFKNLEKIKRQLENTKITDEDTKKFEDEFKKNVELLLNKQNLGTNEPETTNGIEINPDDIEKYEDEGYTVKKDVSKKKYYAYK